MNGSINGGTCAAAGTGKSEYKRIECQNILS